MNLKLLLLTLLILSGCYDRSPSDVFLIPRDQLPVVVNAAKAGNITEIKRLISHFEAMSDDVNAEHWRKSARDLGDAQELYYYAATLYTAALKENDPTKKQEILAEALISAKKSYESNSDESAQALITDINKLLHGM